ncbi:glyoxalase [Aeromonas bestiarum]|uniref:glyoxalase n=1 Tax=Aeromonas bestiarum TaxID=105751 RepID=UPI002379AF76|nr:glyoxalase [Aeromonas bestiarum]
MQFDHIGLVVPDLACREAYCREVLGLSRFSMVVEEPQQQLVYDEHGRCYELVAPAGEESPVVLLLKTRCNVINYMACRVVCKQEIAPRLRELRHLPLDPASRAVPISNFT